MEVKDETKRQGNQEVGDQLRPPSLTLLLFQGKAGVQMSLSSWDFALDSLALLRGLVIQEQACLSVCPRRHEPPGQGWALSETPAWHALGQLLPWLAPGSITPPSTFSVFVSLPSFLLFISHKLRGSPVDLASL